MQTVLIAAYMAFGICLLIGATLLIISAVEYVVNLFTGVK